MKACFLDRGSFPSHINTTPPKGFDSWIEYDQTNADQILDRCQNAEVILTNKVILTRKTLQSLPSLKLICITATGVNNVDLIACREQNIKVVNATNYGTESVSEHVLMLMLALARKLPSYIQANKEKQWSDSPHFCDIVSPMSLLNGKNLVIIGYGTLGGRVGELARAFGMNVLKAEQPGIDKIRNGYLSFNNALVQADFISLHCPLTESTHHLMNESTLSLMKPSAFIVNAGRGPLIDERALFNALRNGKIAGAALDVAENEPPNKEDEVWKLDSLPNVILTPHVAWAADEAMQNLMNQIMEKMQQFVTGTLKDELTHSCT
jgi:glycerate dehydrogenase